MSGKDERPNIMPRCPCGGPSVWIVRERLRMGLVTLVWVNLRNDLADRYGKWHFVNGRPRTMEGAVDMLCNTCKTSASQERLATVVAIFDREHLGDG